MMAIVNLPCRMTLRNVGKFVVIKTLDVVFLHQRIDVLLDISNLGREAVADLVDHLFDQVNVLELLAALHDTHDDSLENRQRNLARGTENLPVATTCDPLRSSCECPRPRPSAPT